MGSLEIRWENSAQRKTARPNPFVGTCISYLRETAYRSRDISNLRIADQGCGNLRHLDVLHRSFRSLFLVDTELQIHRVHKIGPGESTLADYIHELNGRNKKYHLLNESEFSEARLDLDVVLCACVLDVVPKGVRRKVVQAAANNLKSGGHYCLIIPRNDQTVTSRCARANAYEDGHVFGRGKVFTFYANFSNGSLPLSRLSRLLTAVGFECVADLSVYRHLCLILRRA